MESPEPKASGRDEGNLLEYGIKKLFNSVSKLRKQSLHIDIGKRN